MSSWSYRPSLDGLRMLAMYVIVLFHTQVSWLGGGFIAVNLFFVLSGYLVTNVIYGEMDKTGGLRIGRFYARRVRRLLPAAVVAIVGTSAVFVLVAPVVRRVSLVGDAQSALLYVANWRFITQANDYFAANVHKSPFLHFWTLSIEEQFYVVFPLLLLLLAKLGGRRLALMVLSGVFVTSLVAQVYWSGADPMHAYYGTDARAYQLAAGALLAVALRHPRANLRPWLARVTAWSGLATFLVLCSTLVPLSTTIRGIVGTVACVALLAGLMLAEDQVLGRVLSRPIPVYLGKISYATYLWHWPAVLVLAQIFDVGPVVLAILAGVIATAMAAASAELLELPIRRTARLDGFQWRTAVVGVSISALVAATAVPWMLERDQRPALVAAKQGAAHGAHRVSADDKPERLPQHVDWKRIDRDKGDEHTCTADSVSDCIVHRGSGEHVLVIGDSHARMLSRMFTDLAQEHDFTLSMNDVAGCPWQENLHNTQSPPARQHKCTQARVGWYDTVLPKLDPDLVVVVSFPRDDKSWRSRMSQRHGHQHRLHRAILDATRQTLHQIDKVADRTLMVQSIVAPVTFDPNSCMTRTGHPDKCAVPLPTDTHPTDGFYQAAAAESDDFYTVNLNQAFCPTAPVCQPVSHGKIVWRDPHHLTPPYAASRKDQVWRLIQKTGVLN